ncbi:MAG TPA: fatty acid desaturase, partial [Thermoanaerobaculia bacterium]|nr:fatty acid desaturase [Thermoanaerobaculia bacterium]
ALALSGRVPAAVAVAVNALCAYAQFTVAHDAAHGSVSRLRALNDAAGTVAALALAAPFAAFRRIHLHHHAHVNDPAEDPDFWVVGKTWPETLARFATTWLHYYRVYFLRLRALDAGLAVSVGTVFAFAAAGVLAFRAGRLADLVLYWFLPAQLAVTLLAFLFDYLPHRPHTLRGRMVDTVSVTDRWLDAPFLGQNLHLLHHLFPSIPWYRYRPAWDEAEEGIRAEGGVARTWREALATLPPSWRGSRA